MADAQDIFALLLIVLFMANAQDDDSGVKSINSVLLVLLLFGLLNTRNGGCNA